MKKSDIYENKTKELILPILSEFEFELDDVEFVTENGVRYLRVYIDKPEGVTINDCVLVSERMNPILDKEDYIDEAYTFEVSSPDLSRPLKKDSQLSKATDKDVEISLYKPIDKVKQIVGKLTAFDKDTVTIALNDKETKVINRSDIAQMRLFISFD